MDKLLGVDLSHHKTVTSWQGIKDSGVKFVYLKATQGLTYTDNTFYSYVKGSKSVGLPVGGYHFAEPDKDAAAQAKHFSDVLAAAGELELLPVLDLETVAAGVDLVAWARAFAKAFGRPLMLYTGDYFIEENNLRLADMPLWVARYNTNGPDKYKVGGWQDWDIWQYTEAGTLNGVQGSGNVDLNYTYSLDSFLANKEADVVERTPYDSNQFKYLVGLAKEGNEWAKGELAKMMCYVTNGATVAKGSSKTEAVIIYNKVFVPVADVLNLLGISYAWDDNTKTVNVK